MNSSPHFPRDFVRHFLSAVANAALYSIDHPQVTRLADAALGCLKEHLAQRQSLTLMVVDNELVIDNQPQPYSLYLDRLAAIFEGRGIGHVDLRQGVEGEELIQLIGMMTGKYDSGSPPPVLSHIKTGKLEVRLGGPGSAQQAPIDSSSSRILSELSATELDRFMEIYDSVKKRSKLHIAGILEMVTGFIEVFRQEGESLMMLGAIRSSDEYTFTHSTNVCVLTIAQAMALGIRGQQLHDIGISAMLHDIGKVFISEEILNKPGKLTPEEFDIMKSHPERGARYLLDTPGVPRLAVVSAYEHHMKYDLSGYPHAPSGWRLNLCSQLTMISDFFDALRTKRAYRDPVEFRAIAAMMLEMQGKDFHPALISSFFSMFNRSVAPEDVQRNSSESI